MQETVDADLQYLPAYRDVVREMEVAEQERGDVDVDVDVDEMKVRHLVEAVPLHTDTRQDDYSSDRCWQKRDNIEIGLVVGLIVAFYPFLWKSPGRSPIASPYRRAQSYEMQDVVPDYAGRCSASPGSSL